MTAAGWDAIVVGAGPAGSAAAARLAGRGHRVLLLDRAHFPRRKPCGECVNPAGVAALASLGVLPQVRAAGAATLCGWRIEAGGGRGFLGDYGELPGLGIPRTVLDSLLLEHARGAGVEVRLGVRVSDLVRDISGRVLGVRTAGAQGSGELRAPLVVGADGLRSVLVRRLGLLRRSPRLRKLALTAHLAGPVGVAGQGELRVFPGGCLGLADVGDGSWNATLVVGEAGAREVAGDPVAFFDAALRRVGFGDARRTDQPLASGPFDWPTRSAIADGALLVGDAAGYYDPFTGQGIFRALRGAELAAAVADRALRAGDTSAHALAPYERARRDAFAPGERLQHLVELVVSRPALLGAIAARLVRHPGLADDLLGATGDLLPVRTLLRPGWWGRLVW